MPVLPKPQDISNGPVLAWRALLRTIMLVERTEPDRDTLQEEAEEFALKAFEMSPHNSLLDLLLARQS